MEKEKSLIAKSDKRGIKKIVNNVVEFIKSKVNKDYILSESSPEFLKQNRDLILKTIKANVLYLDQVSDDILIEELLQQQLPSNGIIDTAFKRGYTLGKDSAPILVSEHAQKAILQYVEMQKNTNDNTVRDNLFIRRTLGSQWKIPYLLENLDESLLQDVEFREKLLALAIEKGYKITEFSPMHLKQNARLAENYYRDLLENDIDGILNKNILTPELLRNKNFLESYINLLKQKGIDDESIVNSLTYSQECTNALKNDLGLFQSVFEAITPANLEKFFNKFFGDKELELVLTNIQDLHGKLLKVSQLYAKDNTILQSLNGALLKDQYQNIPNYKMQLIAKNSKFQDRILQLNDYEYSIYSKITQLVAQKTDRWNRFEKNIVENLSDGYYGELISDLYEQAKQGNKITAKDLETLTFLLSKQCSSKSFFDEYLTDSYKSQGMDEKSIKQEEIRHSNNVFNITNKKELEHFEEIKELVCDTILTNPSLDDERLTAPISKYLGHFNQLSELDRMKIALLQKYYNMDLKEASNIVNKFSSDIDSISVNDDYQANIIEQIKAIKNIFESNDINILSQIGDLDIIVQTDLSSSTYLVEETKEMFEQLYKENLYMPKEDEKIGNTTYNGKDIEIFEANTDFAIIVKRVGATNENSQDIWNRMTKDGEYGKKDLRYYTSTSYMTNENLLNQDNEIEITFGFAQGTNNYSFDAIYLHDAHTPFYGGDDIYNDLDGSYMIPSTLEMNTDNHYNEVVINTLGIDEHGQMTKMQPDYIVYVKGQSDVDLEGLENDTVWEKSKKAASEFGIPIVVIDREKVKQSEKAKIANMSEELKGKPNSNDVLRFVKKVEHYISRYGVKSILEYAPQDKMNFLRKYIEEKRMEEQSNISVPNVKTATAIKQSTNSRQDILRRQDKLKEKNIIGEER